MAYGSIYSTSRITGLSSGLDTDSLVQAAMQLSQSKMDRLYQQKTSLEWKRDAYTDIRQKASDFSSKYFSALSSDNIFSKSAYKQFKVSVSDKYSSYFSIKGTSNAQAGSHKITGMKKATAATIATKKYMTGNTVSVDGATNANSKKQATSETKLYVKGADGSLKQLSADDDLSQIKLSDLYTGSVETDSNRAFTLTGEKFIMSYKGTSEKGVAETSVELDKDATVKDFVDRLGSGTNGLKVSVGSGDDAGKLVFESKVVGKNSHVSFGGRGDIKLSDEKRDVSAIKGDMTLKDIEAMSGKAFLDENDKISFKINGEEFTFDKDAKVDDIIQAVNESDAKVTMSLDEKTGVFRIQGKDGAEVDIENVSGKFFGDKNVADDTSSLTGIRAQRATKNDTIIDRSKDTLASAAKKMGVEGAIKDGVLKFKINGKTVEFKDDITLDKMMSDINANSDLNVKISYSQITEQFTIESKETGKLSSVTIENVEGGPDALSFFGVQKDANDNYMTSAAGQDAILHIDGETVTRSSNTFVIDGMEITIKDDWEAGVTVDENGNTMGASHVTVEQDIDATVDKVKNFVNAYNELVDSLYGTISEEKDYDYEPLTEDERANLEKEDIEKWETEAKKGLLRNDTTIRSYLSRMRQAIFEKVGGVSFGNITGSDKDREGLSAYDLGFNTVGYETGKYGGRIEFDEDKFREALQRDPEAVANVMAQVSEATDDETNYSNSGFATKLFDITSDFVNTLRGTNIKNTNEKITNINNSMDDLLDRMQAEQERLYQQYAQLETLMTQYQSQSTWLTNQLSGLTTG